MLATVSQTVTAGLITGVLILFFGITSYFKFRKPPR